MKRLFFVWFRDRQLYLVAGTLLWLVIAAASWQFSRTLGKPYLPTMVTWDEWAVAILLLPWMWARVMMGLEMMSRSARMSAAMQHAVAGGSTKLFVNQINEELTAGAKPTGLTWSSRLAIVAVTTFVLDLLVRGVFGLGWQPFV